MRRLEDLGHVGLTRQIVAVCALVTLALSACGEDEPSGGSTGASQEPQAKTAAPVANACPPEGCKITIIKTAKRGSEIAVTWEANFKPDVSKNHIHIFWDKYTADQVSSDAEARGEKQGEWVPTDDVPTYVTDGAVSVDNRGNSTTLCATAGDRDHVVIDSSIVDCQDVSDLL
jgi:hypothetical protein